MVKDDGVRRNYRILELSPENTVVIERGGERVDTGEKPSAWGLYGLTRTERGILRRGMTASGADRRPRPAKE